MGVKPAASMSTRPPGPKRSYPGSLLLQFRRDPLGSLQKITREHGDIVNLRLGRENVYRPAGPSVCKTCQLWPRRSMAPSRGKPVRTPIASPNPLPGPATGAPSKGNHPLRDPADATRAS
jgi:hypothetical protein